MARGSPRKTKPAEEAPTPEPAHGEAENKTRCTSIVETGHPNPQALAIDLAEANGRYAQAKATFQPKAQEILGSLLAAAEVLVRDGQSRVVGGGTRKGPQVIKTPLEPKDVATLIRELKPLAVGDEKGLQTPSGLSLNLNLKPQDVGALVLALRNDVEARRAEAERTISKQLPSRRASGTAGPGEGGSHSGKARPLSPEAKIHAKVTRIGPEVLEPELPESA
jgi:hypothetical protein